MPRFDQAGHASQRRVTGDHGGPGDVPGDRRRRETGVRSRDVPAPDAELPTLLNKGTEQTRNRLGTHTHTHTHCFCITLGRGHTSEAQNIAKLTPTR